MHLADKHFQFHDYEPDKAIVIERAWIPGELQQLGQATEIVYAVYGSSSSKAGHDYIHEIESDGAIAYKTSPNISKSDKTYRRFPHQFMILGKHVGFGYKTVQGKRQVKGDRKLEYVCTDKSGKYLVIVHKNTGVRYVIHGGNLRVEDWIRG